MAETSVFISYRRADSAASTGRIADRLQQRFGNDRIFHDVDSIELGVNFKKVIEEWLDKTDVFLVVIGDDWVEAKDQGGRRRIDDPTDLVRIEVAAALARGEAFPVIPVLVGSASGPPAESELPEDLKSLATRNSIVMRSDANFEGSIRKLIDYIEARSEQRRTGLVAVPPEPAQAEAKPAAVQPKPAQVEQAPAKSGGSILRIGIGAVVVLVAAFLMFEFGPGDDSAGGETPGVSAGRIQLSDYYGYPVDKARNEILGAGLGCNDVYELLPGQSEDDLFVERTDPPAGALLSPGTEVTVYLKHADEWEDE